MRLYYFLLALQLTANVSQAKIYTPETVAKRNGSSIQQKITATQKIAPELARTLSDSSNSNLVNLIHFIATSTVPVVLKFYADWCGPCRRMKTIFDEISSQFEGKIICIEIDIEKWHNMREIFNFKYIPSFIYYKNGKEFERTNSLSYEEMERKIKALIA